MVFKNCTTAHHLTDDDCQEAIIVTLFDINYEIWVDSKPTYRYEFGTSTRICPILVSILEHAGVSSNAHVMLVDKFDVYPKHINLRPLHTEMVLNFKSGTLIASVNNPLVRPGSIQHIKKLGNAAVSADQAMTTPGPKPASSGEQQPKTGETPSSGRVGPPKKRPMKVVMFFKNASTEHHDAYDHCKEAITVTAFKTDYEIWIDDNGGYNSKFGHFQEITYILRDILLEGGVNRDADITMVNNFTVDPEHFFLGHIHTQMAYFFELGAFTNTIIKPILSSPRKPSTRRVKKLGIATEWARLHGRSDGSESPPTEEQAPGGLSDDKDSSSDSSDDDFTNGPAPSGRDVYMASLCS
jgi:hypothetical protein